VGNPGDDLRFLQYYHRGASRKAIEKRFKAYIQPEPEINDDVEYYFEQLGIRAEPEIKNAIKEKISKKYRELYEEHFTYYGRRSVKEELIAMLCFYELEKYDKQLQAQFDDDLSKIKLASEGDRIEITKKLKKLGISPTFVPIDNHEHLIFDHERMLYSFKPDVPEKLKVALKRLMAVESKEIFEKVIEDNIKRYKEGIIRGVSANYLYLLMQFYVLERNGLKKFLKPYRELSKIWGIPFGTFNKKMEYLYKIDK